MLGGAFNFSIFSLVNGVMSVTFKLGTRLINGLLSKRSTLCQTPSYSYTGTSQSFLTRTMASSMSENNGKLVVEHDPGKSKFFIKLGEGNETVKNNEFIE